MKKLFLIFMLFTMNFPLFGQSDDIWTAFRYEKHGLIGYKDKDGAIKIEPQYRYTSSDKFDNIIAVVPDNRKGSHEGYYLTKAGRIVGRDSLYWADKRYDCESEGFIRFVNHKNKKGGGFDRKGKEGMFNRNGDVAIPAEYSYLERVKNGMVRAYKDVKKGYKIVIIDTLNNLLIDNFDGVSSNLDFFSIEKTKTPHPDTIRESFLATDSGYYSFINYVKEFRQWLTSDLFVNLTVEKLIEASEDTIYWSSGEIRLGKSNARQFIIDNFDLLKKEFLEVLDPDCKNYCYMGYGGSYNSVIPKKYFGNCAHWDYPEEMAIVPHSEKEGYYIFLRTDKGYKLTYLRIEKDGIKY